MQVYGTSKIYLIMGEVLMPVHLSGCRGENKDTSDMQVYGTSKIYLIMATKALNEKLKGTGVEVFAAHPGRRRHLAQRSCRRLCTMRHALSQ